MGIHKSNISLGLIPQYPLLNLEAELPFKNLEVVMKTEIPLKRYRPLVVSQS
jgi:hypothetical protein